MKIRNLEINNGIPAVCIPLTDTVQEEMVEHAGHVAQETDIIEWRIDLCTGLKDLGQALSDLRGAASDTPLLATLRTEMEGGGFRGSSSEYRDIIMQCASSSCVDLVDVEYRALPDLKAFLKAIKDNGVRSVVSHHDFSETPDEKEMYLILEEMADTGADIVKLAVMPRTVHDVLSLLSVTYRFHALHPDKPLVTMSMGPLGVSSRVCGGTFGSCITFGCDGKASAPGQLDYRKLKEMIRILDEAGKR